MNTLLRALLTTTACVAAGSAFAADPIGIEPPTHATSAWKGVVEIGGLARYSAEYEDGGDLDDEDTVVGGYSSFAVWGGSDAVLFGLDGYLELVALEGVSEDSLTPNFVGVLGAHVGTSLDMAYLGVFGAVGVYPDEDIEVAVKGYAVGIEGTVNAGMATLFGKVGYAVAGSDEYDPDDDEYEGMVGPFVEAGAVFSISDDLAVMVSAGLGYAEHFDNTNDPGGYATAGAKLSYALPTDFALNLTASYDFYYAYTEEDEDEAVEHTFKIGLSKPFGDESAKASLDPLASPVAPFRAAFSSDSL